MVVEWVKGDLRLYNYLCDREVWFPAAVGAGVLALATEIDKLKFLATFRGSRGALALWRALLRARIYLEAKSTDDAFDSYVHNKWPWRGGADHYHFGSRHVRFVSPKAERKSLRRLAEISKSPSPYKSAKAPIYVLDAPAPILGGRLDTVLRLRRTVRDFSTKAITLRELSTMLAWTWGKSGEFVDPVLGTFVLKTSPSAGARHPTEVYVAAQNIEGMTRGVYHYDVREHGLRKVRAGVTARQLARMVGDQPWVGRAAAVFFMTAVIERTAWKYRNPHAYRVLYLDAGHLGQTFHLVATALSLAPFTSAALHAAEVERCLGIDGVSEIALYIAATGHPAPGGKKDLSRSKALS